MVLSGFLGLGSERAARPRKLSCSNSSSFNYAHSRDDVLPRDLISDETHLRPVEPEAPDLRELNACLEALTAVFPDVQIEVFREMLGNFDGESRLALVADALLKNRATWVKGRWRVAGRRTDKAVSVTVPGDNKMDMARWSEERLVPANEVFKSHEYRKAVKRLVWIEFKGLSKSTINAVLAESNYCYLEARRTLIDLSSKSWRFTLSSMLFRRKPPMSAEAENHPLVIWRSTGQGSIVPCLKPTGSAELDRELFAQLIHPLRESARRAQEGVDYTIAVAMNRQEAEESDETHECACCFVDAPFEEFTSCNAEGHLICFRCVQHSLSEAVYGQGWQRSIEKESGTLRCPAVDGDECSGCIHLEHLHRAMLEQKGGEEVMHKLQQRLAEYSLMASNLPLVRCPFCNYAEVDEVYIPMNEGQLRVRGRSVCNLVLLSIIISVVPLVLPIALLFSLLALFVSLPKVFGYYIIHQFQKSIVRHRRRRRGLKFVCQEPACGRTSCLGCHQEWVDVHVCHESALVALRTQVEQAMSMAIKRVCPRCNTSFVKTAGCNKLTCPCGYKMCYVCRKDIGGNGDGPEDGYRHFCDHFRPEGDPRACTHCNKCNLWETENTDLVLQRAREEAERKWCEAEKRKFSGKETDHLEMGLFARPKRQGRGTLLLWRNQSLAIADVCDLIVESLFV